ncbi:uncharacterized protein LOC143875672 [Tasmannia lanceolata]|uniref:uncharacterized protein LOC143875671 n=1 Tax=Tasmannia lanceolata TaxID=3420 RepID=UPI004064AEF7
MVAHKKHKQEILNNILNVIRGRLTHLQLNDIKNNRNMKTAENFGLACIQGEKNPEFCFWSRPEQGEMKINTDAALDEDEASIGGIIRDHLSQVHAMFSVRQKKEEIHILELGAILHDITLALAKGFKKVESDALIAVNVIKENWDCPWKAISILIEIKATLALIKEWKISHIWREGNSAADYLSKPACCCLREDIPTNLMPQELANIVALDAGHSYLRL